MSLPRETDFGTPARESDKLDEAKAECNDLANLIG